MELLDSNIQRLSNKITEETIQHLLKNPRFISLPSYVLALRRNLILLGLIIITYKASGARIDLQSSIVLLGIPFKDFSPNFIDRAFSFYLLYSFVHYFWDAWETIMAWRIRLSGSFTMFIEESSFGRGGITGGLVDVHWGCNEQASFYSLFAQAIAN